MEIYVIDELLNNLSQYVKVPHDQTFPLRIHSKKLKSYGDISFPLKVWERYISTNNKLIESSESDCESFNEKLQEYSKRWNIQLKQIVHQLDNINLYLDRSSAFRKTIEQCSLMRENYGALRTISKLKPVIKINETNVECDPSTLSLSGLRIKILKKVTDNLINFCLSENDSEAEIMMNLSLRKCSSSDVLCGVVVNEKGTKTNISAETLYKKRSTDMRLMAEHKYGLRMKSLESWNKYFVKLGEAAVTIELIQNKPHKALKISLNDCSGSSNKGPAFILYNCARLSKLLGEFNRKVENNVYQALISIEDVDFSLLQEPEEWELLYAYIMQYPLLIKTCIGDVDRRVINPHHLASFLYNLCAIFSAYYRRVRILITPKTHLIPTLYARIYLMKALQQIFLNTLRLLDIDPIEEM